MIYAYIIPEVREYVGLSFLSNWLGDLRLTSPLNTVCTPLSLWAYAAPKQSPRPLTCAPQGHNANR